MTSPRLWNRLAIPILAAAVLAGCDDDDAPTEPVEEEPVVTVETTTESFSGSIQQASESCHGFALAEIGDVEMTLTDLQPLTTLTVGLGIGTPDETLETGCSLFGQDSSVRIGETLLSAALAATDYCVCVSDVGNIFPDVTVTYAIDVTHP